MFIVNQGKLLIVFAKELKQTNALFILNFKCVLFEDSEKRYLGVSWLVLIQFVAHQMGTKG